MPSTYGKYKLEGSKFHPICSLMTGINWILILSRQETLLTGINWILILSRQETLLQVSSYLFIDDWNKLDTNIKSTGNFTIFNHMLCTI